MRTSTARSSAVAISYASERVLNRTALPDGKAFPKLRGTRPPVSSFSITPEISTHCKEERSKLNAAIIPDNACQNRHMFQLIPIAIVAIPELSASLAPPSRKRS